MQFDLDKEIKVDNIHALLQDYRKMELISQGVNCSEKLELKLDDKIIDTKGLYDINISIRPEGNRVTFRYVI